MFISIYTTRLVLQALGASDFGIFNIVGGAIAMLGFLNISMASATQRFMSFAEGVGDYDRKTVIFNVSVLLHLIVAVIACIALLFVGYFFFNGILNIPDERIFAAKVVYGGLIISTLFTIITVPYDAVLNSYENMRYYALVGILESALRLCVALVCVHTLQDKLIVYGILMACIPLITLTIMRVYCHRHYAECTLSFRRRFDRNTMREMAGFAGWSLMSSMVTVVTIQGHGILLNHFFGTLLNAAHGITNQLNGQLQALSSGMSKALSPVMDKSAGAHDRNLFLKSIVYGSKFTTALFLVIAIPVFLYASPILTLWLKQVPEWTAVFVRFQLLKTFVDIMCISVSKAIGSSGKVHRYNVMNSLANALQLPLIYLAFRMGFPPYFLYVVYFVCGGVMAYSAALYCAKSSCRLSPRYFVGEVILPLSTSVLSTIAVMYLCGMLVKAYTLSILLFMVPLSMCVFAVSFYVICCRKGERSLLIGLMARMKNFRRL